MIRHQNLPFPGARAFFFFFFFTAKATKRKSASQRTEIIERYTNFS